MTRLPAEVAADFRRARHQHRGISGSARTDFDAKRSARHLFDAPYNLSYRKPLTVTHVEDRATNSGKGSKRQDVSASDVPNMHVIPHAGAVRGWIIIAVNMKGPVRV